MRPINPGDHRRPDAVNPGPAPMLQWHKIALLVVDDRYQRELKPGNWKAIRRIAENFRWSHFSPVFVAPVEGGRFAIIDGQHRTHAAALCGFEEVPCQIVQMTLDEQAASFAAVNGMVTKVTHWQIYKAALAAGESWAEALASTALEAGCRVMTSNASTWTKKPGEIYGIRSFREVIESRPRAAVVAALKALMAAEGYGDAPELWDTNILCPLLKALAGSPQALESGDLATELEAFDIWGLIDAVEEEARRRRRAGLPSMPKRDQLETRLSAWLCRSFPSGKGAA
ncbi:ParB N-terminal domain-containing protein [Nitratireductor soli]|uniref:ParB N-terminal domain-containing protein n=1 Tax=Nitratireductor soli TaxID=1670619 RepID=UPI000B338CE2|nr:ParB N-terminal domain-containing protein [Nitratireductor soli]